MNNEEWGQLAMRVAVEVPHRMREVGVLDILMCGPFLQLLTVTYMFCKMNKGNASDSN